MTPIQYLWRIYIRLLNPSCTIRSSSLSKNVQFENDVTIEGGSHVQADIIGKFTYINKYCLIEKNTTIGRFCSIAYNVKIGLGSHPVDWVSTHQFAYDPKYKFVKNYRQFIDGEKRKTIIGNDVWIGANAIILAGVNVGDGAIIGANSLVTTDVEPYAIVYGNPAKQSRFRFEESIIKDLLKIKWWDWDDKKIKKYIDLFKDPLKIIGIAHQ
jgi:virginiamycin A acetyltransferase